MKLLATIAILAGAIVAQERAEASHDLTGRVLDRAGRSVKLVHVRITGCFATPCKEAETRWTVTNSFGYFRFRSLLPTEYLVEARSRRYAPGHQFVDPRFDPYIEIVLLE